MAQTGGHNRFATTLTRKPRDRLRRGARRSHHLFALYLHTHTLSAALYLITRHQKQINFGVFWVGREKRESEKCMSSDTPRNDGGGGAVGKVCVS